MGKIGMLGINLLGRQRLPSLTARRVATFLLGGQSLSSFTKQNGVDKVYPALQFAT